MTALAHPEHPAHQALQLHQETLDRLLRIAHNQIGYHEGHSHGHWNNVEKYAAQVPGLEWANGQAWCDVFASWCYHVAGLRFPLVARPSASCDASWAAWRDLGRTSEYPVIGGQVFYGSHRDLVHTGIVVGYDDVSVITIEGNTNTSGSREGDGVYRKIHNRRSSYVVGYGVPRFGVPVRTPDPHWRGRS